MSDRHIGGRIARINFKRPAELSDCRIVLCRPVIGDPKDDMGVVIALIQRNRALRCGNGLIDRGIVRANRLEAGAVGP
jgi:hypothetical protein